MGVPNGNDTAGSDSLLATTWTVRDASIRHWTGVTALAGRSSLYILLHLPAKYICTCSRCRHHCYHSRTRQYMMAGEQL